MTIFKFLKTTKFDKSGEIQLTDAIKALLEEEEVYARMYEGEKNDCWSKKGIVHATIAPALKGKSISKDNEKIKKEIGTAIPSSNNTFLMKGRDIRSGTPKEIELTEKDACEAIMPILNQILGGIKEALENTPPELSADLIDMGLVLTGGGALLKNIDKRFSKETGLPVHVADDPLSCVAVGTGKALDQEETFSTMLSEY